MEERTFRLIVNAVILAAIGAFWPQIMRILRKIGYKDWRKPPDEK